MTDKEFLSAFDLPPREAIELLKKKWQYTATTKWEDYLALSQQEAFAISGVARLDILQDFKVEILKAMESGQGLKEFKDNMTALFERNGWLGEATEAGLTHPQRLKVIFETNVNQTFNAARMDQQETVAARMRAKKIEPYLVYKSIVTGGTTDICKYLNGIAIKESDPIWDYIYPMNHFGCRSRVVMLPYSLAKSYKIKTGAAVRAEMLAKGLKPAKGFGKRPGGAFKPSEKDYDTDLFKQYEKEN
jgi:SPP1 gp7 family putative phage head morphogenesis protein